MLTKLYIYSPDIGDPRLVLAMPENVELAGYTTGGYRVIVPEGYSYFMDAEAFEGRHRELSPRELQLFAMTSPEAMVAAISDGEGPEPTLERARELGILESAQDGERSPTFTELQDASRIMDQHEIDNSPPDG